MRSRRPKHTCATAPPLRLHFAKYRVHTYANTLGLTSLVFQVCVVGEVCVKFLKLLWLRKILG